MILKTDHVSNDGKIYNQLWLQTEEKHKHKSQSLALAKVNQHS